MPGMSVVKQLKVALLLLSLCVGTLAIDPAGKQPQASAMLQTPIMSAAKPYMAQAPGMCLPTQIDTPEG